MDLKVYISSGILENYVLGMLTEKEQSEVMNMVRLHPEVADYVQSLQQTLKGYGELHQVRPPEDLKASIMETIRGQINKNSQNENTREGIQNEVTSSGTGTKNGHLWRKLSIAAAVLLLISIGLNLYLGAIGSANKTAIKDLNRKNQQLQADNLNTIALLNQTQRQISLLDNPDIHLVTMNGVKQHVGIKSLVYWNKQNNKVYLAKSSLPDIPADKVYQLWAIIDGKPVDLGLYNPKQSNNLPLQMKDAHKGTVQAFAITLENKGGSPTPTMDQMYVMGPVS